MGQIHRCQNQQIDLLLPLLGHPFLNQLRPVPVAAGAAVNGQHPIRIPDQDALSPTRRQGDGAALPLSGHDARQQRQCRGQAAGGNQATGAAGRVPEKQLPPPSPPPPAGQRARSHLIGIHRLHGDSGKQPGAEQDVLLRHRHHRGKQPGGRRKQKEKRAADRPGDENRIDHPQHQHVGDRCGDGGPTKVPQQQGKSQGAGGDRTRGCGCGRVQHPAPQPFRKAPLQPAGQLPAPQQDARRSGKGQLQADRLHRIWVGRQQDQ